MLTFTADWHSYIKDFSKEKKLKVFQTKIFFYYSEQNIHPDFLGLAPLSSEIQYPRLFFSGICVFYFGATLPTKHLPWAEASAVPFPAHASFISEQHCPQKLCPGFEPHLGIGSSIPGTRVFYFGATLPTKALPWVRVPQRHALFY